ncbi:MAG: glycerophosphodiester phosphodiesterase family protein [Blastocatellia bacterium]
MPQSSAHLDAGIAAAMLISLTVLFGLVLPTTTNARPASQKLLLIAHRGASGYAPEHTLASYKLAIEQGADYVEQDLQLTRDGALICLHDPDLARTTNVKEVFPDRATERDIETQGIKKRGWYAIDFTLSEIKQLDAGSWFNRANPFAANQAYVGERIPTLGETIDFVARRAGLYIELKHYPFYKAMGHDLASLTAAVLKTHGLDKRGERVFIQSFSKESLLRMKEVAPGYARVQLIPMEDPGREDSRKITAALAKEIASYAQGVGPDLRIVNGDADVKTLHKAGLLVHPWTFRGLTTASARRPLEEVQENGLTVRYHIIDDIQRFAGFQIDGGFTDYPDLWRAAMGTKIKR